MKKQPYWILGLIGILAVIIVPAIIFWPKTAAQTTDPWAGVPEHPIHTSHADIIKGPFASGQDVTRDCLRCHPDAAKDIMMTTHWTWESKPFTVPGRSEPVTIGKANQINNFCISAQGNQKSCMNCHIGYDWKEKTATTPAFDFTKSENVDCLMCHAASGYAKGSYGNPADTVDLLAAARSVAAPNRATCGKCHFDGGGGNGVKHGDLDESLKFPGESLDVHMGKNNFICTDCHVTKDHVVKGRLIVDNITVDPNEQVSCTQCHAENLHKDERLNQHVKSLACQTCHIPAMALKDPTKVSWDWSTSGQDIGDDHYTYLKIKGNFVYEKNVRPTYLWFNGNLSARYLLGDKIDPTQPTYINKPAGDISDQSAKIFPFKLHVANQPYDTGNNYLLAPITSGPGGYWTTFDWNNAFQLGQERMGLKYSGSYGFAQTYMYWPTTHMVQPKENALQCDDCHTDNGRMDWKALGYSGDPIKWGGRFDNK
ncbi:MAG: tetrathionate reductase family octaheme c-type cytochrome [Chloroflexi bacterium]|nr:tetrathionate reductase family octaheme c-type cytochrome [Chloroflexota bacterium]